MRLIALLLFALLVATQYELWSARGGVPAYLEMQRQIALQLKENGRLRERNDALDAEVHDLKQGLESIEERARSEMGMIKEGEIFFQIIGTASTTGVTEQLTANKE